MSTPINEASEGTRRSWEAQVQWEEMLKRQYADKAALEQQALARYTDDPEINPDPNANALRGLLFGIPLSVALWAGPILVAGLSRQWWLGALAGALEVGAVALWARLGRRQ